jgi:hypothetical protein
MVCGIKKAVDDDRAPEVVGGRYQPRVWDGQHHGEQNKRQDPEFPNAQASPHHGQREDKSDRGDEIQ